MNGVLIIDKDKDMTSRDIVNQACKKLNTKHIGHTGTLDPLATGVLVLCINDGCKIIDLLTCNDKVYEAEVIIGLETDTLDITGNIINSKKIDNIDKNKLIEVLNSFIGKYNQEVPKYSAVHVDGKRLYEYARNNIEVELPKKEVEIFSIELISDILKENDYYKFSFRTHVSKGTYIRSLIRDIGTKLGIECTMSNLRRIKQGIFDIKDSIKVDDITTDKIISIKDALSDLEVIKLDEDLAKKVKNGCKIELIKNDKVIFTDKNDNLLAIYTPYENMMKPYKVFWRN